MTKLSRRKLDSKDFGHYINNLWSVFTLLDSKEQVRSLFRDLITHTEYKMFAKRLEIAKRLIEGQTYGEISEALKVAPNTIAVINNTLERDGSGLRIAYEKLNYLEKAFQNKRKKHIFPRYKGAPRISEVVAETIGGARKLIVSHNRKSTAKRNLSI